MGRHIDTDVLISAVYKSMNENPHKDPTKGICHNLEHQHFLNLIDRCPTADDWISRETPPTKDGKYLCRYTFKPIGKKNMWFYQVFDYYATDKVPHFQHELGNESLLITHWQPINLLEEKNERTNT